MASRSGPSPLTGAAMSIDHEIMVAGNLLILALIAAVIAFIWHRHNVASAPYGSAPPPPPTGPRLAAVTPLRRKLDEWVTAELLSSDEATAVETYEARRAAQRESRLPLVSEAIGYLGAGLVAAALAVLVGRRWESLGTGVRVAVLLLPAIGAFGAGWVIGRRDEPALARLGSVLWVLGGAVTAGLCVELWHDVVHDGSPPEHGATLFVAGLTLLPMAVAWWLRKEPLQHLALFVTAVLTGVGVADAIAALRDTDAEPLSVGLALGVVAAVWLGLGLRERLEPAIMARLLGAVLLVVSAAPLRAGNAHLGLWFGLGVAAALLAIGVARTEVGLLLTGAVALFVWVPQIAVYYLEPRIGIEVTLAVVGALLIALAGSLAKLYPAFRRRGVGMRKRAPGGI